MPLRLVPHERKIVETSNFAEMFFVTPTASNIILGRGQSNFQMFSWQLLKIVC